MLDICKRYQPEALSIEKLYYQHNQTTVIGVAEARGVILLAAAQCGVPIYEYTPMQVKQAITGYGKAVKKADSGDDPHDAASGEHPQAVTIPPMHWAWPLPTATAAAAA